MMMDIVPTILDWCGMKNMEVKQPQMDGKSLVSTLIKNAPSPHESIFWATEKGQMAVREGSWKLVINGLDHITEADSVHLSNLEEDQEEKNNLSTEHPEKTKELHHKLMTWLDHINMARSSSHEK